MEGQRDGAGQTQRAGLGPWLHRPRPWSASGQRGGQLPRNPDVGVGGGSGTRSPLLCRAGQVGFPCPRTSRKKRVRSLPDLKFYRLMTRPRSGEWGQGDKQTRVSQPRAVAFRVWIVCCCEAEGGWTASLTSALPLQAETVRNVSRRPWGKTLPWVRTPGLELPPWPWWSSAQGARSEVTEQPSGRSCWASGCEGTEGHRAFPRPPVSSYWGILPAHAAPVGSVSG